ncbi:Trypsin-like peptidase domain-containing protein [Gracilibacillus orientalis]|uniref:Trypsin-like peptidase domain-containing protein n=1 Tax=Gracilibacillus orientalis TaxID=334253 RepID=A0A1I4MDV2_9BACI|nr:S1C family serine protease [Gracilibacillus orientalis]SFM01421.1 Trypsin-like peptidase domain-containing protein [Gracilibacillus orientalis]
MYKKRKYIPVISTGIILLLAIIAGIGIYISWVKQPLEISNTVATNIAGESEINLKNIIHQSQKSVVQIESTSDVTKKTGSGFVINNQGDIITNAHVIEDADTIVVKLTNAREYPAAVVGVGDDQDFAVIRVPELNHLEPIALETDKQADIGDEIIAIGSPMGIQNSVSLGLIVGTDRSFSINDYQYDEVYQISANITHGNSGGPLISRNSGKVVGVNSAGISDTDIGFSIPISQVAEIVSEWTKNVEEDELTFLSPTEQQINKKKLKEDALYIADYFFDNIGLRDYVNAYSLLGSQYQDSTSYTEFRQLFQALIDLTVQDKTIIDTENDEVHMEVNVDITRRNETYEEVKETRQYVLVVGYENDQLKILKLQQST